MPGVVASGVPAASMPGMPPNPAMPLPPVDGQSKKKNLLKPLAVILAIIVLLSGGSVAAFYAVIVPNKPANILKTAFINTAQQQQFTLTGSANDDPTSGGIATKGTLTAAVNLPNKAFDVNISLTISGYTVSAEARYVNQNLYIKAGDLSGAVSFLSTLNPKDASTYQSIANELSNKWIEADIRLQTAGLKSCYTNLEFYLH